MFLIRDPCSCPPAKRAHGERDRGKMTSNPEAKRRQFHSFFEMHLKCIVFAAMVLVSITGYCLSQVKQLPKWQLLAIDVIVTERFESVDKWLPPLALSLFILLLICMHFQSKAVLPTSNFIRTVFHLRSHCAFILIWRLWLNVRNDWLHPVPSPCKRT